MQPEENINSQEDFEENNQDVENVSDIVDFIDIVNTIVFYYTASSNSEETDSSETWKLKANLIKKVIPEEVDDLVKQAFVKQLKRFT